MKLLILGGTIFLGRHLVEAALKQGHDVTLFNRGLHGVDLYPNVEKLHGNRLSDLSALEGRQWDAVIDTNGFVPSRVRATAQILARTTPLYAFISTISVYADLSHVNVDETAPVETLTTEQLQATEQIVPPMQGATAIAYGASYGALKALCEQAAEATMPGRVLTIRPGIIVGPYDYSDRFTYWVHRIAQGGEVLAPGRPERQVQIIDARDLAEWIIRMLEAKQTGTYNATGPDKQLTMQDMLETCKEVSGSNARFTWLNDTFLLEAGAQPWSQVPLWLPETDDAVGLNTMSLQKVLATDLAFRPLAQTAQDTLAWDRQRSEDVQWQAGLSSEDETQFLQAWHRHIQ
jgi:2'-hydroxyisoflavone reductase